MLDLTPKKSRTDRKPSVRPGTYTAHITDVFWTPGYIEGSAFTIQYTLTDAKGKEQVYEEIFYNHHNNTRTCEFIDHLKSNGITELDDFVGCTEEVVIAKNTNGYRSFPSIDERTFISAPGAEDGT